MRQKYVVLRNCFTADCVYYSKGDIVELPDAMFKDEKNFRLLEKPVLEPEPVPKSKKSRKLAAQDKPESGLEPEPEPELEPSPSDPAMTLSEPVVHNLVPSKGKKLKCSCGKTYKTEYGLKRHLEDNA